MLNFQWIFYPCMVAKSSGKHWFTELRRSSKCWRVLLYLHISKRHNQLQQKNCYLLESCQAHRSRWKFSKIPNFSWNFEFDHLQQTQFFLKWQVHLFHSRHSVRQVPKCEWPQLVGLSHTRSGPWKSSSLSSHHVPVLESPRTPACSRSACLCFPFSHACTQNGYLITLTALAAV